MLYYGSQLYAQLLLLVVCGLVRSWDDNEE